MQKYLKIGVSYLKGQYFPHLLLTLAFCLASVGIMSFRNLDEMQSARVLEMYVSFGGILLLTPLFMPEQNVEIWQLEKSKATPMWQIYLVRIVIAVLFMVICFSAFPLVLEKNGSVVLWEKMWIGGISEMFLLGAIGFFISAVTNQVVIGYMIAVIYYVSNFGAAKKLGKLGLFQMMRGEYGFAGWMLAVGILLIVSGILLRERKK